MFYVKEPITDNMEFQMEITDKNVFCRCPVCGKEVPVNLEKVLGNWSPLEDVYCGPQCGRYKGRALHISGFQR